jgi:hypothetical protein
MNANLGFSGSTPASIIFLTFPRLVCFRFAVPFGPTRHGTPWGLGRYARRAVCPTKAAGPSSVRWFQSKANRILSVSFVGICVTVTLSFHQRTVAMTVDTFSLPEPKLRLRKPVLRKLNDTAEFFGDAETVRER